jgi:hypothetical protein
MLLNTMINKIGFSLYLKLLSLSRFKFLNMSQLRKIFGKGNETAVQKIARKCGKGMQNNDQSSNFRCNY